MMPSVNSGIILLSFLIVTQREPGTSKTISLSVTVYNKHLSSQCNVTIQIEQVQENVIYPNREALPCTLICI